MRQSDTFIAMPTVLRVLDDPEMLALGGAGFAGGVGYYMAAIASLGLLVNVDHLTGNSIYNAANNNNGS